MPDPQRSLRELSITNFGAVPIGYVGSQGSVSSITF
jgi:hypothetical protein